MSIFCRTARRAVLLGGALLCASLPDGAWHPAEAQLAVVCPLCSSWVTQLVQDAREAQSYATQLQQYQTQLSQYSNMVQNTVALPYQVWGSAQADIMQVRALSNASAMLGGSSGSMLARLNSATGYANQVGSLANMPNQILGWQQAFSANTSALGRTLGLQQSQQQNNAAVLAQLQAHSTSAQGQMQALQAGNELAGATVSQLMQVQATISASAQYAAERDTALADRQALGDAAAQQFLLATPPPTTGYMTW
jgi:P-type conjugative transfer protein TrbJ